MIVVTVRVSNAERTLREKTLIADEDVQLNKEDPLLKNLVAATVKNFGEQADDVNLTINMVW